MKRIFDIVISLFSLVILFVPLLLISVIVRFKIGSPIFFTQLRPGLKGIPFTIIKFRTMQNKHTSDDVLLPDNERLTKFGSFLRASSIDELPELWNVLRGDMSLVGPRPLLMEYLQHYTPDQGRRHDVRPGITGWAQINGRNSITWDEKFSLDIFYIENQSLLLDCKIVWLTISRVITRENISANNHTTMPNFKGKKNKNITKK